MKKETLLFVGAGIMTLLVSLVVLRFAAPRLFGTPVDLQLVQVAEEVPPFFDGVFRDEDITGGEFIIRDPYILRAKPLAPRLPTVGPNDLLGFRNTAVPAVADIVTIGDSQTYGNNVHLEENWPSRLAALLPGEPPVLYNMSVGGWGAVEYLQIFTKALYLRPSIIIVAFYTGNDPMESFMRAYGDERMERLRPDRSLTASDAPRIAFPPPEEEWWTALFRDGRKTSFTPLHRLLSNREHPTVRAGYAIMAETAREMGEAARRAGVALLFTVIPTKELVFAEKISREGIEAPEEYTRLVRLEGRNLESLAEHLKAVPSARYVDVLRPLQLAALQVPDLYPEDINGHPLGAGYAVIAETMAEEVAGILPGRPEGAVAVKTDGGGHLVYLVRAGKLWTFDSRETFLDNGWSPERIPVVRPRDIVNIPFGGVIRETAPSLYGPNPAKP